MSHPTSLFIALLLSVAVIVTTIVIMRPPLYVTLPQASPQPHPIPDAVSPQQPQPQSTPPQPDHKDAVTDATSPLPQATPSPHEASLKHVIEAIYDAAMKAQASVQINNLHNFLWMFPQDENGIHSPRTIPIQFSSTNEVANVPVFTLLHHQNLCIHDLKIKTSLDIEVPTEPKVLNEIQDIKNKKYKVRVKRTKKDNTTIEIHLTSTEPTDMYHRMFEKCQNSL